jgi:hypothetical protein
VGVCHYCTRLARYLFGIVIGLERAGRQPCRHPSFGALDQFLDEIRYCITSVACKAAHFCPGAGVEIESDAHLLAIDTKMAFTVLSWPLGIGQVSGRRVSGVVVAGAPPQSLCPRRLACVPWVHPVVFR